LAGERAVGGFEQAVDAELKRHGGTTRCQPVNGRGQNGAGPLGELS
jgi:hypothetical protein